MARELKDSPDGIAYGAKGWIDFRQLFLSPLRLNLHKVFTSSFRFPLFLPFSCFRLVLFIYGAGDQTQGLTFARQMLYNPQPHIFTVI
jgi:hypothetical protein